jgi:hypothetical protein
MEAELPNFWEQESSSGYPAAPLPYPENAWRGGRKASSFSAGGLYGRPFGVSTPENDKTDKKQIAGFEPLKPPAPQGFSHPRR